MVQSSQLTQIHESSTFQIGSRSAATIQNEAGAVLGVMAAGNACSQWLDVHDFVVSEKTNDRNVLMKL
uniref:Transposase n=1 Tax=Angiostrongylus cantonensis TaxID=6313 RepID=A0A0K0CTI9_ANGCA